MFRAGCVIGNDTMSAQKIMQTVRRLPRHLDLLFDKSKQSYKMKTKVADYIFSAHISSTVACIMAGMHSTKHPPRVLECNLQPNNF